MESEIDRVKQKIKTLEEDVANVDEVFDRTANKRDIILDKIMDVVNDFKITDKSSSREIETQLAKINTASSVLNDMEKAVVTKANLKVKLKDMESQDNHNEAIIETLKAINLSKINTNYEPINEEKLDKEIEERIVDDGLDITDGELETTHVINEADIPDISEYLTD